MEPTVFLAQLWAPTLLALGLGMLVSPAFYKRVYRDIEKQPLALVTLALILIPVGVVHIMAHNSYDTLATGLISLLGWGTFLKGVVMSVAPAYIDRKGDWAVQAKIVPTAGIVLVIVAAYLGFVGYLA